ncbi:MAG: TMEM175 family protein [Candidatus Micrarchaeia archaeon]
MEKDSQESPEGEGGMGFGRMIALSDGVFSVAMTLLVINLTIPDGVSAQSLLPAVISLWPKYLAFVLSFYITAMFWMNHHRMFRSIRKHDYALLWLNLILLFFIVTIPFVSMLIGEYGDETPIPVIFYALILAVAGFMEYVVWDYATGKAKLVEAKLSKEHIEQTKRVMLTAPAIFLVSVLVAPFNPQVAMLMWLLIYPAKKVAAAFN